MWRGSLSQFLCKEDSDITDFLVNKALEYEKRDRARTYIYFDQAYLEEMGELKVISYFSTALKTIKIPESLNLSKNLKKKLGNLSDKDNNIVVYLIGQLGRDSGYNASAISGKQMLEDCYALIESAREVMGGRIILLECKPHPRLCKFYESEGYIDITEDENGLRQYIKFIS